MTCLLLAAPGWCAASGLTGAPAVDPLVGSVTTVTTVASVTDATIDAPAGGIDGTVTTVGDAVGDTDGQIVAPVVDGSEPVTTTALGEVTAPTLTTTVTAPPTTVTAPPTTVTAPPARVPPTTLAPTPVASPIAPPATVPPATLPPTTVPDTVVVPTLTPAPPPPPPAPASSTPPAAAVAGFGARRTIGGGKDGQLGAGGDPAAVAVPESRASTTTQPAAPAGLPVTVDAVIHRVTDASRKFSFPLTVAGTVLLFLGVQGRLDGRDPKLAAPLDDEELTFT